MCKPSKPGKLLRSACYLSCIIAILILMQLCYFPAAGLTDLDWRLGSSKYSQGSVSDEAAFHGSNCADLSVDNKGTTVRARI